MSAFPENVYPVDFADPYENLSVYNQAVVFVLLNCGIRLYGVWLSGQFVCESRWDSKSEIP